MTSKNHQRYYKKSDILDAKIYHINRFSNSYEIFPKPNEKWTNFH